jgi:hypothetical protein
MTGYLYASEENRVPAGNPKMNRLVAETVLSKTKKKPRELILQCSKVPSLSRHCNGCVKFEFNDKQLYTKQRSKTMGADGFTSIPKDSLYYY